MYKLFFLSLFLASSFLSNAQKKIIIPADTLKTSNTVDIENKINNATALLPFKILNNFSEPRKEDFTRIDISQLNFDIYTLEGDSDRYYADIAFEITNDFYQNSDFIFAMLDPVLTWSILKSDKVPIVKSMRVFFDETGVQNGVRQGNENLKEPINKRGTYFVRIVLDELPTSEEFVYLFVGERRI